jgi:hypothetical protein
MPNKAEVTSSNSLPSFVQKCQKEKKDVGEISDFYEIFLKHKDLRKRMR